MEKQFEKNTFAKRLKSMLRVDTRRMFTSPLVYIMAAISLVVPVLILVMTMIILLYEKNYITMSKTKDLMLCISTSARLTRNML